MYCYSVICFYKYKSFFKESFNALIINFLVFKNVLSCIVFGNILAVFGLDFGLKLVFVVTWFPRRLELRTLNGAVDFEKKNLKYFEKSVSEIIQK